jgi:hypothetical protein
MSCSVLPHTSFQHVSLQGQVFIFKFLHNISSYNTLMILKVQASELLSIVTIFATIRKPIMTSQVFFAGETYEETIKNYQHKKKKLLRFSRDWWRVQEQGQGDASTLAIGGLLSGVSTNQAGLHFFSYRCNTCKTKTLYWKRPTLVCCRLN